jgi:hypothetical protein
MESGIVTGAKSDIVQMQFLYMGAIQKGVWNIAEVAKFKNGQMRRARSQGKNDGIQSRDLSNPHGVCHLPASSNLARSG